MGARGPLAGRPRARIVFYESGPGETQAHVDFDHLDPEICLEFQRVALEMGIDAGRLLEQLMRSFLNRREAPRNRT